MNTTFFLNLTTNKLYIFGTLSESFLFLHLYKRGIYFFRVSSSEARAKVSSLNRRLFANDTVFEITFSR